MANKEGGAEVIDIGDTPTSCDKSSPLRPIFCLKNRGDISKYEEREECFILDFDPYDELDVGKLSFCDDAGQDFCVVAEKGQVACRDYPHPRHSCAKFPFETTPHEKYCELCYCYVCDLSAPCTKWKEEAGYGGHCHAFKNLAWTAEKDATRVLSQGGLPTVFDPLNVNGDINSTYYE